MTCAVITQPTYLPWLGYFEQMARADVFVFLDCVQFVERSWHSRNRLKGTNGQPFWLTVPVKAHPRSTALCDVLISPDQPRWRHDHLRSMQSHLGTAPHFEVVYHAMRQVLEQPHEKLVDMTIAGIRAVAELLDLTPRFLRASQLHPEGRKTELLVDLCKKVGAKRYYSAVGSKDYIDLEADKFAETGIELTFQTWEHPTYPQRSSPFVSHLAAIDAIANMGVDAVKEFIRQPIATSAPLRTGVSS